MMGMSQRTLAEGIGLTFQQLQKYERGSDRISAGRLFQISQILEAPITYFFDGLDPSTGLPAALDPDEEAQPNISTRETLELMRAFHRIADPDYRQLILEMVNGLNRVGNGKDRGGEGKGAKVGH
jgi:transcriptional regulator with XRE-family HTH domain